MKKIYFLLFIISFISNNLNAQSPYPSRNFDITFEVKGIKNETAIIGFYYGNQKLKADEVTFDANGVAKLQGKKELSDGVYLLVFPSMQYRYFEFIIKETAFTLKTDTADFSTIEVIGSPENKVFTEDTKKMGKIQEEINPLRKERDSIFKTDSLKAVKLNDQIKELEEKLKEQRASVIKKYPSLFYSKIIAMINDPEVPKIPKKTDGTEDIEFSRNYIREHYFDNVDFGDSNLIKTPVFYGKVFNYLNAYTDPEPDSLIKSCDLIISKADKSPLMYQYLCIELLNKYAQSQIMGHDKVYCHLAEKYYLPKKAWWADDSTLIKIQESVLYMKPTLIGNYVPRVTGLDKDSIREHKLDEIVFKYDYTVLAFWDPDCSHCKHDMPMLRNLWRDTLLAKNIGLVSVSISRDRQKILEFVDNTNIDDIEVWYDPTGRAPWRGYYDLRVTPLVLIIDKEAKIIAKRIEIDDIDWYITNWKKGHQKE